MPDIFIKQNGITYKILDAFLSKDGTIYKVLSGFQKQENKVYNIYSKNNINRIKFTLYQPDDEFIYTYSVPEGLTWQEAIDGEYITRIDNTQGQDDGYFIYTITDSPDEVKWIQGSSTYTVMRSQGGKYKKLAIENIQKDLQYYLSANPEEEECETCQDPCQVCELCDSSWNDGCCLEWGDSSGCYDDSCYLCDETEGECESCDGCIGGCNICEECIDNVSCENCDIVSIG